MGSVCGMIGVIYPQTLVPHNKDRDSGLLREVDAVPCTSGSVALWVIREREAEIGSQLNHLLIADGASSSAVLLPVGSMDLSLEIEQALSVESGFGVCACCATVYESGVLLRTGRIRHWVTPSKKRERWGNQYDSRHTVVC